MSVPLKVLIVEDSPDDAALAKIRLRRGGYLPAVTRVETPDSFREALKRRDWDLVIADYALPHFTGLDALEIFRSADLDVPFIIVSGTIGEEIAVSAMRAGAHDYIMKDNLARLCPAVDRELREARTRREVRRQEEALRESERRFRSLFESNHSVMLLIVPDSGAIADANPAACAFYGYDLDTLKTMNIADINTLPREEVFARMREARSRNRGYFHFPHRLASGEVRDVEVYSGPIQIESGRYLLSIVHDITERRRAERSLEESEGRYRTLFEQTVNPILVADGTGRFIDCNNAACQFLEVPREEILRRGVKDVLPSDIEPDRLEGYVKAWETGDTIECDCLVNGRPKIMELTVTQAVRDGKPVAYGIGRDVTERRRAERERHEFEMKVQQAQKLESLGVLAGGIAHDFNNLLMGVLGYADMALAEISPESPARESIRQIDIAARRAADLSRQMLAYSGRGAFLVQPLDLSRLVEEMAHLLAASVSKKAVLKYYFQVGLPLIEGDATQIRQIVMNLITNASDAIGDNNGIVSVSTGAVHCDEAYLKTMYLNEPIPAGLFVSLEVSDTGCGMDEETKGRIFDPFFTTKFTGRGLGLAAVLGIVRGHHGAIRVYSELGKGTSFKVLFPASLAVPKTDTAQTGPEESWKGVGTVLVADDEEAVRSLVRAMLERMGFEVLAAANGRECVEIYRENKDKIRLVLLDMTMPHMNGEEAFRELRLIDKNVRVLLSSGYNEQDATTRFAGKGLAGFIQKPYQTAALNEKLRQILAKR
ncbi:response regulator [Candidatus Sumerlaeota bacterium]|nr:response regulator [Candidatus Sumerlaeota bacterium]